MLAELRSRPGHDSLLGTLMRWLLIGVSLLFLAALLIAPLITVFAMALAKGIHAYLAVFDDPDTLSAIKLTLITAAVVVPANTVFGLSAAWCIAKFEFRGKSFFTTLIDLPMAVSPVIVGPGLCAALRPAGLVRPVAAGPQHQHHLRAAGHHPRNHVRDLPVRGARADSADAAARQRRGGSGITLGAGGWLTFFRVTLPKVRWGLIYGIILCNARAMGEFGAVSVVSGHIRGLTNTMPLHVEILYREYNTVGAFAVASLLTLLAVVTLVIKTLVERRGYKRR